MATQPPAAEPGWFQKIVEMLEGGAGGPASQVPPQAAAPPGGVAGAPMPGAAPPNPNDPAAIAEQLMQRNQEMAPYGQTGPGAETTGLQNPGPNPQDPGMIAQLLSSIFGGGAGS